MYIHHRHLINDNDIRFQRIFCISFKMNGLAFSVIFRHSRKFEKTMDRLCLIAGSLCHTLRCPSGWSRQPDLCTFALKISDDRIDCRCFSGTGTAGENKQAMPGSFLHCFFLHFIQSRSRFFLYLDNSSFHYFLIFRAENIKFPKHSCRI